MPPWICLDLLPCETHLSRFYSCLPRWVVEETPPDVGFLVPGPTRREPCPAFQDMLNFRRQCERDTDLQPVATGLPTFPAQAAHPLPPPAPSSCRKHWATVGGRFPVASGPPVQPYPRGSVNSRHHTGHCVEGRWALTRRAVSCGAQNFLFQNQMAHQKMVCNTASQHLKYPVCSATTTLSKRKQCKYGEKLEVI